MTGHPQSPVERWIGSHSPAAQELANRLARPHLGLICGSWVSSRMAGSARVPERYP